MPTSPELFVYTRMQRVCNKPVTAKVEAALDSYVRAAVHAKSRKPRDIGKKVENRKDT